MLFNSSTFLVFFIAVYALYYILPLKWRNPLFLVSSYLFYGWWDWRFTFLLALSTVVDYSVALRVEDANDRGDTKAAKRWLLLSCVVNLGILGVFKYFDFFVGSASAMLDGVGFHIDTPVLGLVLPVGISFYTFQTMSYTIDVYRGVQKATRNFMGMAVYVAFFPQLVAGPIERSVHLLPQIIKPARPTVDMIRSGAVLIVMGYFKKVFLADTAANIVENCFSNQHGSWLLYLVGVYAFAIQIYGDFAGYTDIARGVARLFGVDICLNFRQPYFSRTITEFWRRWHISLSAWLRDYLYIPLGGNRKGRWKTYRNLMLTMLLGGLWHGASWNFVIWGGLHGVYLAIERMIWGRQAGETDLPAWGVRRWAWLGVRVFVTFHLVCLAWVFFRASTVEESFRIVGSIFTLSHGAAVDMSDVFNLAVLVAAMVAVDVPCWLNDREVPMSRRWPAVLRGLAYAAMVLIMTFWSPHGATPFIYFQF